MKVQQVIVKEPGETFTAGLTTADLGKPDLEMAKRQHNAYIQALRNAGAAVKKLDADEQFPDAPFVEDPAVVAKNFAVITRPGAETRRGETASIRESLEPFYKKFYEIEAPGTLEGGDVLQIEDHFYIGLSNRTNHAGASQLKEIMEKEGFGATVVKVEKFFHLKTGVTYLGEGRVIAAGEFIDHPAFKQYETIPMLPEEEYAANCLRVNDTVILPDGFPDAKKKVEAAGYQTIAVEMSEFQKQDGGLSCLSLRF